MAGIPLRLTLNAVGVKQGERDVNAAFNRIKVGAKETATAIDTMGRRSLNPMTQMGAAVDRVGGKSKNLGFVINNISNQIGDFAVQVSMGTSAIRALGMQAPQAAGALAMLGGPFTAIATGLGLVAALGLPFIGLLMNMGGEAKTTADRVGELSDAVDGLSATARLAKTPIKDLYDEYGVMATKVREAADEAAKFDAYEAARTARNLATQLTAGAFAMPDQFSFLEAMVPALDALKEANREMTTLQQRDLASLINNFEITGKEALGLYDALQAVNNASTDEELATAYLGLSNALSSVRPDSVETAAKIKEWRDNARNAGGELSRVLEFIRQIKENGTITIDVAYSQTMGMTLPENPNWFAGLTPEQLLPPARRAKTGGGKSAIEKERDELKRFAEGIKPVLTLLQEYEQNMTKLNRAKEIGAITTEQFAAKEQLLTERFQIASGAMVDYTSVANTFASSLEQGLMSMVDGTMSVEDAFKNMATAVIKELYRVMVVQQLVNSVMGAFGYSRAPSGNFVKTPVPSLEGGGYTGDGARSGGLDGRGGFMAMLHPNETVVDHTKGQSGGTVVNQTINISAGVSQTVRAEMMNMLPQFRQQAQQGVLDAKRRGGAYGGSFA